MNQKIFVGTSGWSFRDWAGVVYPRRRPKPFAELSYLAEFLDAVEINTSFYRPPPASMCAGWVDKVAANARFTFTAKLWQRFTHERGEAWTDAEATLFKDGMRPLQEAEKLGALLVQFPWSFPNETANRDWLKRLADAFRGFQCVVEVRHASWDTAESRAFLQETGLGFCNIDQPTSSKSIGPTNLVTGPVAYYRFHGRNRTAWFDKNAGRDERYNYLYSTGELAPWISDIRANADKAETIFVMNNNHYRGQAVVNALQIRAGLTGDKQHVPPALLQAYPVLNAVAAPPRGQQSLPF